MSKTLKVPKGLKQAQRELEQATVERRAAHQADLKQVEQDKAERQIMDRRARNYRTCPDCGATLEVDEFRNLHMIKHAS